MASNVATACAASKYDVISECLKKQNKTPTTSILLFPCEMLWIEPQGMHKLQVSVSLSLLHAKNDFFFPIDILILQMLTCLISVEVQKSADNVFILYHCRGQVENEGKKR